MKNLKELLNSSNYRGLDKNQAYEHGEEQEELICSLFGQFPNVDIEDNWVELFFQYVEKLFEPIYERNGFSTTSKDNLIYVSTPYTSVYESLRRLLWDYMLNTPNKLDAIQQIRSRSIKFIKSNTPNSLAVGWFIDIFLYCGGTTLTKRWELNAKEEQEVLLIIKDLLDQIQNLLTTHKYEFKDFDAIYSYKRDLRDTINEYYREQSDNISLTQMSNQLNLIELMGFHDSGLIIHDSFKKFYKNDKTKFSSELLEPNSSENQILSNGINCFETDKKTAYILLLIRYFLVSMDTILIKIDNVKEIVKDGGSLGNIFGVTPLEDVIECLFVCTDEIDEITNYLGNKLKPKEFKIALQYIINDNDYNFIKSKRSKVNKNFIKELVNKSCNLHSSEKADIDLKRLLLKWGMVDKSLFSINDSIIIPESLPQSVSELNDLMEKLKLAQHLVFNKGADDKDFESRDFLPEDIKEVYKWKNGLDHYDFVSLSEQDGIVNEILWQFEDHKDNEDEVEDYDFSWPDEIDIRKHIHDDIIGIGRVGNGDFYFIDPKCLSKKGKPIVFRNSHDSILTAKAVANSLEEYLARIMIERCVKIYGQDEELQILLKQNVVPKET